MAKININDEQYDGEDGLGIMSVGAHIVAVHEVEAQVSQNSGKPMVTLGFTAIGPQDADKGKTLRFQHFSLSDKAIKNYVRLARAAGMPATHDPELQKDVNAFLGKTLVILNKLEKGKNGYEDRVRMSKCRPLKGAEKNGLVEAYGDSMLPDGLVSAGSADGFGDDADDDDDIDF